MALSWYRWSNTKKPFAKIRVEFRYELAEIIDLLARYHEDHNDFRDDEAIPLTISKSGAEKYIRNVSRYHGDSAPWFWRDGIADEELVDAKEWAFEQAVRFWPNFAADVNELKGNN